MLSFLVDNLWCYQRLDKAVLETKLVELGRTVTLASICMWRSFCGSSLTESKSRIYNQQLCISCFLHLWFASGSSFLTLSFDFPTLFRCGQLCTSGSIERAKLQQIRSLKLRSWLPDCWIHSLRNAWSGCSAKDS
jgi:hypothetical protein